MASRLTSALVASLALVLGAASLAAQRGGDSLPDRAEAPPPLYSLVRLEGAPAPLLQQVIALDLDDAPLETALKRIASLAGVRLTYSADVLPEKQRVSLRSQRITAAEAFQRVLQETDLSVLASYSGDVTVAPARPGAGAATGPGERAQETVVAGRVTNAATAAPLSGAAVSLIGTDHGAVTNQDGVYSIRGVPPGRHQVQARILGFAAQTLTVEVAAGRSATADFALAPEALELEGVVVIGYGTQRRLDVTGAVVSIPAEQIGRVPAPRLEEALQGRTPGVQISTTSNHPGGTMQIRIRGGNSLQGDNNPLVVIDGVLGGDLQQLNPQDIASVEVLKDASATAIYGARGSNGVILVTTKRGTPGEPLFEYSGYAGMQSVSRHIDVLDARQHAELIRLVPGRADVPEPATLGRGTDWQDVIFRDAPIQSHQLSVSGGSGGTRFLLSGAYLGQDGVILNSDYSRASARLNLDQEVSDRFRVGTRTSYSRSINNLIRMNEGYGSVGWPVTYTALAFSPIVPPYDASGGYSGALSSSSQVENPLAVLNERENLRTGNYLISNLFGEYDLLEGLTFRTSFGYTLDDDVTELYTSRLLLEALNSGRAEIENSRRTDWLLENTLTARRTFGGRHDLDFVGGFTAQEIRGKSNSTTATGFPSDLLRYNNLGLATNLSSESNSVREALASFLGRLNYSLDGKYLFTVSARADGASKFPDANKWALFPSAAVGWRVSEEAFMERVPAVSNLKLRASYGRTGSQAISAYQSLAAYSVGSWYTYGSTGYTNGARPSRISNPNLKWETTAQYDVGFDLGLLDDRVTLTADYYRKETSDLLYNKQLPMITGFASQVQNIGSLENRGFEVALDTRALLGAVEWSGGANFSLNRNRVLDLGGDEQFTLAGVNQGRPTYNPAAIVRVGEPVGNFYGYVFDGIFQNSAELEALNQNGRVIGGVRYRDLNGDGRIDEDDKVIIGNALPDYTFGLHGAIAYRGLDLSFVARGVQGNEIANLNRVMLESVGNIENALASTLGYWRGEGTSNSMQAPGLTVGDVMSSRWVEDGSFVRLQNVTLGYELPERLTRALHVRRMRPYLAANNLFTWTDYSWYDPEVDSRSGSGSSANSTLQLGWDDGGYPGTRSLTLGVNVGF